jgi:putative ABC transport system permease protein
VRLLDGRVVNDSRPEVVDSESSGKLMTKRTTMSFGTALKTSANNLLTKKGRTLITALAGSIGIIGIALVLSISEGMNIYVRALQSDTLAGFPITVTPSIRQFGPPDIANPSDLDYPDTTIITEYNSAPPEHRNNISDEFVDYLQAMPNEFYNAITYSRAMSMRVISRTSNDGYNLVSSTTLGGNPFAFVRNFYELPNNEQFILSQYDVLAGTFPTSDQKDKLVLVVDIRNRIDEGFFNRYGIDNSSGLDFNQIVGSNSVFNLRWISNNQLFFRNDLGDKVRYQISNDYETMYSQSELPLEIAAVIRVKPSASAQLLIPGLAYSRALTTFAYEDPVVGSLASNIVVSQQEVWANTTTPPYNILGSSLTEFASEKEYENTLKEMGGLTTPVGVQIYPSSFENKDAIKRYIDKYNYDEAGNRRPIEEVIIYTDLAENITSTITDLINTITIVLTAFASISLIVSSVMIGIITYVSVIERTKEIGIMRSLGARKKDIARIFNAETIIIGFVSGVLGVLITLLLNIPIDIIIFNLIDVGNFTSLSPFYASGLVFLSTFLTLLAGLIPSGIAARKDPVIALRTE